MFSLIASIASNVAFQCLGCIAYDLSDTGTHVPSARGGRGWYTIVGHGFGGSGLIRIAASPSPTVSIGRCSSSLEEDDNSVSGRISVSDDDDDDMVWRDATTRRSAGKSKHGL